MELISKIIKHKNPQNNVTMENKVLINGDLISLIKIEKIGDDTKEIILNEFKLNDLKKEYQSTQCHKEEIENICKELGVDL